MDNLTLKNRYQEKKMKRLLFFAVSLCLVLPACSSPSTTVGTTPTIIAPSPTPAPSPTSVPTPASPFNYDSSVPFDTKVVSETARDGATVVDLTYATHDPAFSTTTGGRTVAYLVKPQGQGPFAGVIFLHWLGVVSANRGEYLDEAVALAQHGVVSLLLQGYFPWMSFPMGTESDHQLMLGQVRELRRAVDFLLSQPGVDPDRLGYVGHDYGAMYGGVLAGVEHRLKTYVLIAGTPNFVDFGILFGFKRETYQPVVQDLDPDKFVPEAAPASLLFQFGENDAVVPKDAANRFFEAASQPKQIEWYPDIHDMHNAAAREARLQWLTEELKLQKP
jgi:dienelactone hydrolase